MLECDAFHLRPSEQPAVIDIARETAVWNSTQIVDSPGVRTVVETGTTGVTSEWETTWRWRTVPCCFFLRDRAANERAAGCADGRADGCALHMSRRCAANNRTGSRAIAGALSGIRVTRI